jgi:prepilin-type N-terminal cleavage/methylation domain-containing protein
MRSDKMRASGLVRASGRAFTLMEMMVGVAAVAIVAVGLAAIFDSVGKTVAGGRRVSVVNTYSTLIESQMRRDFQNMARDGFLIIRHQWVDLDGSGTRNGDRVPLFANQPNSQQKERRIDELQFGVVGKFETARQPLVPGVKATANEAVVYYGHGERATTRPLTPPRSAGDNFKKPRPRVDDSNLGSRKLGQPGGENQVCSDWTLSRHVTLLASPESTQYNPVPISSGSVFGATNIANLRNQRTQFALQPAASSLFRTIATLYPDGSSGMTYDDPTFALRAVAGNLNELRPLRSSGIIDIASTSFEQIRAMVTTCIDFPMAGLSAEPRPERTFEPVNYTPVTPNLALDRMHAWLQDTLPTDSRNERSAALRANVPFGNVDSQVVATPDSGHRIRYEPDAVDLFAGMTAPAGGGNPDYNKAAARADQLMLATSNFVPHCTNFVVEWTYGTIDNAGNVLWYGLRDSGAQPYGLGAGIGQGMQRVDIPNPGRTPSVVTHYVTPRLIYGVDGAFLDNNQAISELTAHFGYVDPTYAPNFNNLPGPLLVSPTSAVLNWAWPKMIRVKVTLADPNDFSESTFTYVFDVPDETDRKVREAS